MICAILRDLACVGLITWAVWVCVEIALGPDPALPPRVGIDAPARLTVPPPVIDDQELSTPGQYAEDHSTNEASAR